MIVRGTSTTGYAAEAMAVFLGAAFVVGAIAYLLIPALILLGGLGAIIGITRWRDRRQARRAYLEWAAAERARNRRRLSSEATTEVRRSVFSVEDDLRRAKDEAGGIWP